MKKHLLAALAFILSVVFLAGCATDVPLENDYTVRVMLLPCDGITIEGDNIVDITAGRNVSFKAGWMKDIPTSATPPMASLTPKGAGSG